MEKQHAVYIMTNKHNTVIFTGWSGDFVGTVQRHRNGLIEGFTKKYNVTKLVWYRLCNGPEEAAEIEKKIKGGSRAKKMQLVKTMNPEWKDLYETIAKLMESTVG